MALDDGSLDAVFAISVWSRFGPRPAARWLAEMHRLVRPGGLLIITTQGIASLAHYLTAAARSTTSTPPRPRPGAGRPRQRVRPGLRPRRRLGRRPRPSGRTAYA